MFIKYKRLIGKISSSIFIISYYKKLRKLSNQNDVVERVRSLAEDMVGQVRFGGSVNQEKVMETIDSCISDLLLNSNDLSLFFQLSLKSKGLERHAIGVCILAISFGHYLNYPVGITKRLGVAGLFHDIGLLNLADDISHKIFSEMVLNEEEFERSKQHVIGIRNMFKPNSSLWSVMEIIYSHHERFDGDGYPRGLKAVEIPILARIISIVEVYDSLTNDWSGSPAISSLDALEVIYKGRGTQFDPDLVLAFVRFINLYPIGSIVQLYTGDIGVVVKRNNRNEHLPTVLFLRNKHGKKIKPKEVELQKCYDKKPMEKPLISAVHPSGSFGINLNELIKQGVIERS